MKNQIEKLQSRIIMWSPETPRGKRLKSFLIRLTDHVIYPEFRDPKFAKRIKAVIYTPMVITACSFMFLAASKDSKVIASASKFMGIESDTSIFDESSDYELLKAAIEDESGIAVPEVVPYTHLKLMYDQCQEKDVPVSIFFRMVHFESNFDSTATSRVGARGYCQVMPATFSTWYKKMGLNGGKTATNNIKISVQLLSELEKNFIKYDERKKWELVLSSYNAGIGRVIDAGYNIPNISEKKKYVNNILNGVEL